MLFVQYCVETLLLAGRYITWHTLPLTHCHYGNKQEEESGPSDHIRSSCKHQDYLKLTD